jgi:hypothetical protein
MNNWAAPGTAELILNDAETQEIQAEAEPEALPAFVRDCPKSKAIFVSENGDSKLSKRRKSGAPMWPSRKLLMSSWMPSRLPCAIIKLLICQPNGDNPYLQVLSVQLRESLAAQYHSPYRPI